MRVRVHPAGMGHLGQSTRNTKTQGNKSGPPSKVRHAGGCGRAGASLRVYMRMCACLCGGDLVPRM